MLAIALLAAMPAAAEVYKWTDADGRTHFSDTPVQGATAHRSGSVSAVSNPAYNMQKLSSQLPFTNENGAIIVQGKINGVAMRFIVDTGAALVVIPPEVASEAGIVTQGCEIIELITANGRVSAPLVNLDSVRIGDKLARTGIRGTVQTVSPVPRTGLLGMSFLDAYRMTIDHQHQRIVLENK